MGAHNRSGCKAVDNGGLRYSALEGALRPPLPTATRSLIRKDAHKSPTGLTK